MHCSSTGRTGVAPAPRAALPSFAGSWVTIFGLLMVVAIRALRPRGMRSTPLAAARGSFPLIQRGSCLFPILAAFVAIFGGRRLRLRQRFVDQARDLDALLDPFVLDEPERRREAGLEPASQLRLHEAGRVFQTVHAEVLLLLAAH